MNVDDVPSQVDLFHVSFWVRVHNLPIGFMNERWWGSTWPATLEIIHVGKGEGGHSCSSKE